MNAAAILLAERDPDRIALVCGTESVSYGALRNLVARNAAALLAHGAVRGDRVAVKLPDGAAWVGAYLGAMWAGVIAVAVNPRIPPEEWRTVLALADFRFIVAESPEDTPLPWRERVVTLDAWQDEVAAADPVHPAAAGDEEPAFWTHSSGTSGTPKAVVHAHRFACEIERVSAERLGLRADDRLYASSKLFFSYPQTNSLYAGLKLGATVILDPQWPTAAGVAATVAAQRPTVFFSVPSLYRNLLKEGRAPEIAAQGVRMCVSAGEALPAQLRDEWHRQTGLTIANGYGASETLVLVLTGMGDDDTLRPSPGFDIEPLEGASAGAPTRIRIRGSTVALGYWNRPEAQAEHFRDGAFCPADLFVRTDEGSWRFAGREDALVKIAGRWVNLVDLEERLATGSPGIAEAAAVLVPDSDGIDALAVFYVARGGNDAEANRGLQSLIDALPHHQRPRWLHAIPALPRTATGKLLRRRLQDLHRSLA